MTYNANVFFDFLLQKSLAGTLPATLAPFADKFTKQTADLAIARMTPFCALHCIASKNIFPKNTSLLFSKFDKLIQVSSKCLIKIPQCQPFNP